MKDVRLIETVRIRDGVAPLWYLHLRRLATSCKALGIPLPGRLLTPGGGPDRVHRIEVGRRDHGISERPVGSTAPIGLILSPVMHRPYPHKTTDRAPFDATLAAARAVGADDGVLRSEGAGYVTEAAQWGLFWWDGDALCAPPLDLGILPGVARARLTELVGTISEVRVPPEVLHGRSIFVANAVRGVVEVAEFAGHAVPMHPATAALAERFWS